uniref:G-protein comlpex beta subunit CpcB n=1 Tax=Ganoderma boninense TaxID=34458 RepID=A0A5K1K2I8_9APHY|nr:G-protein comlpex beta subunit CpcB [Ganoderma boninense]
MASSAIRARINAFEAMQAGGPVMVSRSPSDLLETPISPTATSISPILPSATSGKSMPPSPSPSPPNLGRKTSLIDLKDWVVDDGPLPYVPRQKPSIARKPPPPLAPKPTPRHISDSFVNKPSPPLISLDSPPKTRPAPPLPPRKTSYSSLKSISPTNTSNSRSRSPRPPVPPLPQPTRSDSLTVDHTYPPLSKLGITIPSRHAPGSSISSFHSVSLSSDGGDPSTPGTANSLANHVATYPMDRDDDHDKGSLRDLDAVSLDESFENLSMTSAVSPSVSSSLSHDWEVYAKREPPKLPQRPSKPSASAPTSPRTSPHLIPKRDGPPPPPPRSRPPSSRNSLASTSAASTSDRSSILSNATSHTSVSTRSTTTPKPKSAMLTRPTPVPPAARKRYEAVFNGNVVAVRQVKRAKSPPPLRKPRQAAGWRGLSVDLITNPEEIGSSASTTIRPEPIDEEVDEEDRLDGETVKAIWKLSRLERATLRVIWMECDPTSTGSLDRDGFVKGMWRIDEELRKAQMRKPIEPRIQLRQPKPSHPPKQILR